MSKTEETRIKKAVTLAYRYAQIDGSHHRLWVIDQMLRILLGEDKYSEFVYDYNDGTDYVWDIGIAP